MTQLLEAALAYAAQGWRVFPITRYKTPFKGMHGHKDGTTDSATIARWWADWPWANVALATGEIVVFDADQPEGLEMFKALGATLGGWPPTLAVKTQRGFHFYYRAPAGVNLKNYASKRPSGSAGIDVRATGGLVALPPSVNKKTGFVYQWINPGTPIAAMTPAMVDWVQTVSRQSNKPPAPAVPVGETVLGARPAWLPTSNLAERMRQQAVRDELPEFLAALKLIDAACGYHEWWEWGGAIHTFDSGELGLKIFKSWSLTSSNTRHREEIEQGHADRFWAQYKTKPEVGQRLKTKASIYAEASKIREAQILGKVDPASPNGFAGQAANGHHALPDIFTTAQARSVAIRFVDFNKDGDPRGTCANARIGLQLLGINCAHDVFHDKLIVGGQIVEQWAGDLTDHAVQIVRVLLRRQFGFDPGGQNAHDACVQEALQHSFDPVQDYLDALVWDGTPRLRAWLTSYMEADATPLNHAIGELALVAAVRRAHEPGAKFDQIIVLEGPEGQGKSLAIETMAGVENFSDQRILTLDDKGQQEAVQGVWLYEIGELTGINRAEVESVKAFASRTHDRARPAYGRIRVDRPRRCVFFASTNNDTYLKSPTGNRRFWPVRTRRIDVDALKRDRDQLWAEASMVEAKLNSLVLPNYLWGAAGQAQETRRDHDPWDDLLSEIKGKESQTVHGVECRISTRDLLEIHLKLSSDRMSDVTAKRLAYAMRRLGWDGPKVLKDGENTYRGYSRRGGYR